MGTMLSMSSLLVSNACKKLELFALLSFTAMCRNEAFKLSSAIIAHKSVASSSIIHKYGHKSTAVYLQSTSWKKWNISDRKRLLVETKLIWMLMLNEVKCLSTWQPLKEC